MDTQHDTNILYPLQTYSYEQPEKRSYSDSTDASTANLYVESGWR